MRTKAMAGGGFIASLSIVLALAAPALPAMADEPDPAATEPTVATVVDIPNQDSNTDPTATVVDTPAEASPPPVADPAPPADVTPGGTDTEGADGTTTDENSSQEPAEQPAPQLAARIVNGGDETPKKVFVCKYVGTPGVDEHLQTGNNPISVSVNAIQNNQWDGSIPGYFSDAHDRSYVLGYDTGQAEPDVSACPTPVGPPPCVDDPTYLYTFDPATGSGIITVTGGKVGEPLCDPLYVRAVAYHYDVPVIINAGHPSWPQTQEGHNDTLVDKIGEFAYAPPQIDSCRQYDIHASFSGWEALAVPEHLLGSHDPYEPAFLHETLPGSGPNPTWSFTTAEGCNPPVVIEPKVTITAGACYYNADQDLSFKPITLTYDNTASNQPVEFVVSAPYGDLSRTVPAGESVTVQAQDGWQNGVGYQVTAGGQTFDVSIPAFDSCKPPVLTVHPANPTFTCDAYSIPGGTLIEGPFTSTDPETGDVTVSNEYQTGQGSYTVNDTTTTAGVRPVLITFVPYGGLGTPDEPAEGDTYTIVTIDGVKYAQWAHTFEACPTPTPTPTPPTLTTTGGANTGLNGAEPGTSNSSWSMGEGLGFGGGALLALVAAIMLIGVIRTKRSNIADEAVVESR